LQSLFLVKSVLVVVKYIVLGVAAFVLSGFFDLAAIRGWRYIKQFLGLASVLLFGYALLMAALQPGKFQIPAWLLYSSWFLLFLAGLLLVYSLFLEIPFRQTYAGAGVGGHLVKTGTYALVRHPGVLWLAGFLLASALVSRSRLLLLATPVWILADVVYVWIQEKIFLVRIFPGYEAYREQTPMLIPTRTSIGHCFRSLRGGEELDTQSTD
jgi:protein-S-isoprenylcysteine O-methyltransferase Ste14